METIVNYFPNEIKSALINLSLKKENLTEIRIRKGQPFIFYENGCEFFLCKNGTKITSSLQNDQVRVPLYLVEKREFQSILEKISHYSLYAYENEVRQGFLTVEGGHRIGIAGKTVIEDGKIKTMENITGLNFRIAHQIKGIADPLMPFLYGENEKIHNTMIISPPGCGKTTMLRDLIRQISNGVVHRGWKVGVVDERNELSGSYMGEFQNDLGIRTDVIEGSSKMLGMNLLIRSMSPEILAVDEISGEEEVKALCKAALCGCKILFSVHGDNIRDLKKRKDLKMIFENGLVERFLVLSHKKNTFQKKIYDQEGVELL